jgi:hypothetical protein
MGEILDAGRRGLREGDRDLWIGAVFVEDVNARYNYPALEDGSGRKPARCAEAVASNEPGWFVTRWSTGIVCAWNKPPLGRVFAFFLFWTAETKGDLSAVTMSVNSVFKFLVQSGQFFSFPARRERRFGVIFGITRNLCATQCTVVI